MDPKITSSRPWPPVAMALLSCPCCHGALELPMLLARGVGEGPASPFQPVWKGRIRRKALPATMSAAPSPRQMALAEKDFW